MNNATVMKAAVHIKYGSPEGIVIREVKKPVPKKDEVLIKIVSSTMTSSDILLRTGKFPLLFWLPVRIMFGIFRPRNLILGYEIAGIIQDKGEAVKNFQIGDEVFGGTYWKMSAHSEYICLKDTAAIGKVPENIELKYASALPDGASTALSFLQKAKIEKGQQVLIYGASGSVGTYAVQIAKYFGAKVTAVCSYRNIELVKSLGADEVIDYTKEDYGERKGSYDIVFDTLGKSSYLHAYSSLKEKGKYVSTTSPIIVSLMLKIFNLFSSKKYISGFFTSNQEKLKIIRELTENEDIKPVIDRTYSLNDIREAHEYVESRRKRGNVIISMDHNDNN